MFNENRSCIEMLLPKQMATYILFNENRSCIEINKYNKKRSRLQSLMKTEVVLKSSSDLRLRTGSVGLMKTEVVLKLEKFGFARATEYKFNENRSCIEINTSQTSEQCASV